MKKMILAAALALSSSAFAQMCEVDMIDNYTNRPIKTIRAYDFSDGCKEGMKACRLEIRKMNLTGRADCVRAGSSVPTNPGYPNPGYPNPGYPDPTYPDYPTNPGYPGYPSEPNFSYDARRILKSNESVIYNNKYVTVIGSNYSGNYAVRSTDGWNSVYNNVSRESLTVTNGCSIDLCTSASVINTKTLKYVKVAGISFYDTFAVISTDGWNSLTTNVDRNDLAKTEGCVGTYYSQICTGSRVLTTQNKYATVVGIQLNGRLVLRSTDGWNTLTSNVDPSYLVVTN